MRSINLIRDIIVRIILLSLYLLFYLFLKNILKITDIIDLFIILILLVTFDNALKKYIHKLIHRKFYLFITKVEKALTEFNNKLNQTIDYYELIEEYNKFLDIILSKPIWAFYIFKKSSL